MKAFLGCLAVAACGGSTPPPVAAGPIVNSLTPQAGLWGTEVTIVGANFGPVAGTGVVAFAGPAGANGFVVDTWNEGEIRGRVAFPATGMMAVQTPAGTAQAGSFTTTEPWQPSAALDVAQLVDEAVLSTGDVAGLYREFELANQPTLAVFGGGNSGAYQLAGLVAPQDTTSPLIARLVEADDHTPEVIATKLDNAVVVFGVQGAALVTTATGLTGTVVAAARDQTGVYAWIETAAGIVRARPGTPWTVDRGPIATTYPPLAGAVAADGTLGMVVGEPAPSSMAYLAVAMLTPTATQLGVLERADPTSYANLSQAQLVIASDGIHAIVLATSDASGTPTSVGPRLRTATATWSAAPAVTGLVQYAFVGTTLAALVNDAQAKSTSLVPDATMPAGAQVIPVWPMQSQGFVVDSSGNAHPLLTNGAVTYALTPP